MRILYSTSGYTPHDARFLQALAGTPHDVHYLPLDRPSAEGETLHLPEGIRRVNWTGGSHKQNLLDAPRLRRGLRQVVADLQPDVLHAGPVTRSALLAAWAGIHPLVTMSWGSDILWEAQGNPGDWAARYTLARSDVLVCDCHAVRQAAARLGMNRERIIVFPWGVDLDHFRPGPGLALRERLGWEEAHVVLSARNFEPIYGVDVLARGFILAARSDPALRLLLVGIGSLRRRLEQILQRWHMLERAHFAGSVELEDLPEYYRACDLYVTASRSDGSSVSLLEAMACGKPSIVSDIPGNREWVRPEQEGWWFRQGRSEDLAAHLSEAFRDPARLREMGDRARRTAEGRADWRRNFPLLLQAYDLAREVSRRGG
jgi:glycosyltransferase involved in cell wall biosynthesis